MSGIESLLAKVRDYLPPERVEFVEKAYRFAERAHDGQVRKSGDPYITHPLAAAEIVAGLQLDANTVAATLLHDVLEDCGVTLEELKREFNAEVAKLVDGATKLEKVDWRAPGADSVQAENLRKMFLAMAEDVRVVIIKLADRLHNMRTLDFQPEEKRRRIAQETMDIFAPLAGRMGIWNSSSGSWRIWPSATSSPTNTARSPSSLPPNGPRASATSRRWSRS
jgi:guanosine-3',5'-bis(diphosphate) 3'-pyrophosphohydrolase